MTTIQPALEASSRAAVAARTEELFRRSGALRDGHFLLKSGRHGDAYVEKFAVLSDPAATSELCGFWTAAHRRDDGTPTVDLVAGPTTGGLMLAMLPAVEAMGGEIVDCVVLVDRSGGRQTLTSPTTGRIYPLRSL